MESAGKISDSPAYFFGARESDQKIKSSSECLKRWTLPRVAETPESGIGMKSSAPTTQELRLQALTRGCIACREWDARRRIGADAQLDFELKSACMRDDLESLLVG